MTIFCAANEIAFPMTGNGAVLDFCGPFPDGNSIYDLTARVFKDSRVPRAADANMPCIWERARPSKLEAMATALITVLAFSGREHWVSVIRTFLKNYGLEVKLRGRPRIHPTESRDLIRGMVIDRVIERLRAGFEIQRQARLKGGYSSGNEDIRSALKLEGHSDLETKAIVQARTLQDAACRYYYYAKTKQETVILKGVRNSYSRYKASRERQSAV